MKAAKRGILSRASERNIKVLSGSVCVSHCLIPGRSRDRAAQLVELGDTIAHTNSLLVLRSGLTPRGKACPF